MEDRIVATGVRVAGTEIAIIATTAEIVLVASLMLVLLRPPLLNPCNQLNQLEERGLSYSNSASSLGLNMSMTRTDMQRGLY